MGPLLASPWISQPLTPFTRFSWVISGFSKCLPLKYGLINRECSHGRDLPCPPCRSSTAVSKRCDPISRECTRALPVRRPHFGRENTFIEKWPLKKGNIRLVHLFTSLCGRRRPRCVYLTVAQRRTPCQQMAHKFWLLSRQFSLDSLMFFSLVSLFPFLPLLRIHRRFSNCNTQTERSHTARCRQIGSKIV